MHKYLLYISEDYSFKILRPLQEEILKRGGQAKWFVEGNNVNTNYFKEDEMVLSNVKDVIKYKPDVVLAPGNFVPSFIPGIKVKVFHGFLSNKRRKKDNVIYHFIIRDCFDVYCTQGPSSTLPFLELEKKHKTFEVIETGYCMMDPYFKDEKRKKQVNERPIVLFSSTFSPRMTKAPVLLETIKKLSKNTKWQWLVTFHPKMDKSIVDAYKAIQHDNLTFIETDNLVPYMEKADVMLADFSSMITEFILLNKPVVTFQNYNDMPYVLNVTKEEDIDKTIEKALTYPEEMMIEIKKFSDFTHPYTDGKSSTRLIDALEEKLNKNNFVDKKPLNIIRNLKARKELSYWSFN